MKQRLVTGQPDMPKPQVFGHLWALAALDIKHWRSDLYHDAMFVAKYVNAPGTFYYGVRDTGTSIGLDRDVVKISNDHIYEITITKDDLNKWDIDIWELKEVV